MDSLKRLQRLTPDADRSERVRMRCRSQIQKNERRVLSPAVVGGICLFYTVALVITTLRLEGLIQQ